MAKLPKLNEHDGLIHEFDGSKHFIEGGKVGGVNSWIAKSEKDEDEEKEGHEEEKNALAGEMKDVAAKKEAEA